MEQREKKFIFIMICCRSYVKTLPRWHKARPECTHTARPAATAAAPEPEKIELFT